MGSQPEPESLGLLPWPRSVDLGSGDIRLAGARVVARFDDLATDRIGRAVDRLSGDLASRTTLSPDGGEPLVVRIRCSEAGGPCPGLEEDESYWLVADDAGVFLDAASEWGVLHGLTTLGQLIDAEGRLPHVAVDDGPRFPWRGLLLDPARHFLSPAALERTVEGMARCKLNVLHLHLSDDQGFRFPVPAFPGLASAECYREEDLQSLVAHAADRGVRVVPEIDMPGHVTSWLTAYPRWGARQVSPTERFGVHPGCLDPASEAVYQAIDAILEALVRIFPDPCLHIGGDEVSPRWWAEDPGVAELMGREGLADVRAVQGYFNRRVGALVEGHGRTVVAWDEVLDDLFPERWIVQAWRGATARDRALARGHRVVQSAPYYLDLNYPVDVHLGFDPGAAEAELLAAEDRLGADPRFAHVAQGLAWTGQWREGAGTGGATAAAGTDGLLGGEACLWGELVTDAVLDVRLWGRLPALAELFWTRVRRETDDVYRRLDGFLDRPLAAGAMTLDGLTATRLEGLGLDPGWLPLVAMLEPVKWYSRLLGAEALAARIAGSEMPRSRPYDTRSPLDGLVDHLPPESRAARSLTRLCKASESKDASAVDRLGILLERWQDLPGQDAPLPPGGEGLPLLGERLGMLAEAINARLAGERAAVALIRELLEPAGELMLAMPAGLHAWLTGR